MAHSWNTLALFIKCVDKILMYTAAFIFLSMNTNLPILLLKSSPKLLHNFYSGDGIRSGMFKLCPTGH